GHLGTPQPLDVYRGLVEVHVDRIDLLDGGEERRGALTDQRSLGYTLLPGAAGNRRGDGGVAEVDACGADRSLRLLHGGGGRALGGLGVVEVRARYQSARQQLARALCGDVRVGGISLGLGERGERTIERRAQRRRIDLKERLARLDVGALRVQTLQEHAGD